MTRGERELYIHDLENRYPVNKWVIGGVHLWPLIKVRLSLAASANHNVAVNNNYNKPFYFFSELIKSIIYLASVLAKKKKSIDEVYCSAPHFRYKADGIYKHRYFNGLKSKLADNNGNFLVIEYNSKSTDYIDNIEDYDKTIFISKLLPLFLALREISWFFYKKNIGELSNFEEFTREVVQKLDITAVSYHVIIRQLLLINIIKRFYARLIKKFKIKNVYTLCYYVSEMYAMNLAAAECNISSCDIQHGGLGHFHKAYTNYFTVPKNGYKLMPKLFWCWDKSTEDVINKWVKLQDYHSAKALGNPWIEFCMNTYAKIVDGDEKIILYTLANTKGRELLDRFILTAIQDTKVGFKWWIRLHPLESNRINDLDKLLMDNGLSHKVEIQLAQELPLPAILCICHVHISKWSGSIIECSLIGKKSIIIDKFGVDSYPEIIDSGLAISLINNSSSDLIKEIEKSNTNLV